MSIPWTDDQRSRIEAALASFPVDSGRCADLARHIQPIARDLDPETFAILIRPKPGSGRYVVPRAGPKGWFHHVSTVVASHCVDALTGAPGTPHAAYLQEH